jgi:hypothetical protein
MSAVNCIYPFYISISSVMQCGAEHVYIYSFKWYLTEGKFICKFSHIFYILWPSGQIKSKEFQNKVKLRRMASSRMLRRVALVRTEFQRNLAPPSSG